MVQNELDRFVEHFNGFHRRKNKNSSLPTGCCANYCYANPVDEFGGVHGLIKVPASVLQQIAEEDYPERDCLWTHTPAWFSEKVDWVLKELQLEYSDLHMQNFWSIFPIVLEELKGISWEHTPLQNFV